MRRPFVPIAAVLAAGSASALFGAPASAQTAPLAPEAPVLVPAEALTPPNVRTAEKAVETVTLGNGARLVVLYEPKATTVVTEAFFQVGLGDEGRDGGINALIARTWSGESKWVVAERLRRDVARIGAVGTDFGDDWAEIWSISGTDPSAVARSLQTLLVNMVTNPLFSPELVEAGKAEQLQEIALENDSLVAAALNGLRARAFGGSAYGLPALGTGESVAALTAERVTQHYQRYFRPDRAVFVVAGPIKATEAKSLVEANLGGGGWGVNAAATPSPKAPRVTPERIPVGMRDMAVGRRAPATVLAAGFLAPGTTQMRRVDYATLLILDAVLGGGKSARLFRSLRDEGEPFGYDVRTVLSAGRGQSLWSAYVIGDRPTGEVRNALLNEIDALAGGKRPVTEDEVERARAFLLTRHLTDRQRQRDRAFGAGWAEVMGLGADFDVDFAARLSLVTADDVNTMARQVLGGTPAVVYTLPLKPAE